MGVEERLAWLFADIDPGYFDPANEYDREVLIRLQHPELRAALSNPDVDEIDVAGHPMNPRLHVSLHQGVADQIVHDEPPEVWQTALRLEALGYDRHDVLHMLAVVLGEQIRLILIENQPHDRQRYLAALAELPDSWEAMRPRPGRQPAGGGVPGRRRRRKRRRR